MKKIILIPDSFKGTISSQEICEIMESVIHKLDSKVEILKIPVADGGEGSVDCFLQAVGGKKHCVKVTGVFGEEIEGYFGMLAGELSVEEGGLPSAHADKKTAIVEMAACAGLPLAEGRLNPEITTTYGVGQLILEAADCGAERIIIGLGGSATNDAGCGAAAAIGIEFYSDSGESFIPTGRTLRKIAGIDMERKDPRLKGVEIIAMCDIDNPMFGNNGAAHVFAPQKGADQEMVLRLDEGLRHLDQVLRSELGMDFSRLSGGGAAGAMGVGMAAFFSAELRMGIDTVLETVNFLKHLEDTDMVFTGEGKIDDQSLRGKAVIGIARQAAQKHVPVIAIVGEIGEGAEAAYSEGVTAIFSINNRAEDFSISRHRSKENLFISMENVMRFALECWYSGLT